MIGDKELAELRRKYYGLLVNLLWKEPEPAFVTSLADGLAERVKGAAGLNDSLAEGWRLIGAYLAGGSPDGPAEEFTHLFLGPHEPQVVPYESYYLTGKLFQGPLVDVRGFMKQAGLEKTEGENPEPEDILAFELDIMNWLIGRQLEAEGEDLEQGWLELQAEFLKRRLLVWAPACAKEIAEAEGARFYRGVGMLLAGFLEMERDLFRDLGPPRTETLEEARQHYGRRPEWKGPLFDPTSAAPEKEKG